MSVPGVSATEKRQSKAKTPAKQVSAKALLPCKTCPWRVDADVTAIPGFDSQKAVGLLGTASLGDGDAFRPIMACHHSKEKNDYACKGYLAREGWNNLNVRILLAKDKIENPSAVLHACETQGVHLEPNYPAVLDKLAAADV
jgi:Family of unknown function (DUF6283)